MITIVHGRRDHLRRHVEAIAMQSHRPRHVVVRMGGDDPRQVVGDRAEVVDLATSGTLPLARARNVGAEHAADADLLVFLDVDVVADDGLVAAYRRAADAHPGDVFVGPVRRQVSDVASGRTTPDPREPPPPSRHGWPPVTGPEHLWSLSMAVGRHRHEDLGGFDEAFVGWGAEDTDLGLRVARSDAVLRWVPLATGWHQWHPVADPADRAHDLVANAQRFFERWGRLPYPDLLDELHRRGLVRPDPVRGIVHRDPA